MRKTAAFPLVKGNSTFPAHMSGLCPVADGFSDSSTLWLLNTEVEIDGSLPLSSWDLSSGEHGALFSPTHQRPSEWQELALRRSKQIKQPHLSLLRSRKLP